MSLATRQMIIRTSTCEFKGIWSRDYHLLGISLVRVCDTQRSRYRSQTAHGQNYNYCNKE